VGLMKEIKASDISSHAAEGAQLEMPASEAAGYELEEVVKINDRFFKVVSIDIRQRGNSTVAFRPTHKIPGTEQWS